MTQDLLKAHGLRDTEPRRLVIDALRRSTKPSSPQQLHAHIIHTGHAINLVTVYRVLSALTDAHIVHMHPCDHGYTLCSMPDAPGHHGFLHCSSCGRIEEFNDERLCKLEDGIARAAQFRPRSHVSEIIGFCKRCPA